MPNFEVTKHPVVFGSGGPSQVPDSRSHGPHRRSHGPYRTPHGPNEYIILSALTSNVPVPYTPTLSSEARNYRLEPHLKISPLAGFNLSGTTLTPGLGEKEPGIMSHDVILHGYYRSHDTLFQRPAKSSNLIVTSTKYPRYEATRALQENPAESAWTTSD